jgi:hypothetical protein
VDQISRFGMDTSKRVFSFMVNVAEKVVRKKLRHKEMMALFQLAPTIIAIKACGGRTIGRASASRTLTHKRYVCNVFYRAASLFGVRETGDPRALLWWSYEPAGYGHTLTDRMVQQEADTRTPWKHSGRR